MKHIIRGIASALLCAVMLAAPMQYAMAKADTRTLTISGFYKDEITRRFVEQNPGVSILFGDDKFTDEDSIKLSMLSRDSTCDIYIINSDWGLSAIAEKGYYYDLSGSQVISEALKGWYTQIKDTLSIKDKIVGYPVNLSMEVWAVNRALEAIYPTLVYPKDYMTYLQSIAQNQMIREDYDINYVIDVPNRYRLMSDLIRTALLEHEKSGALDVFNSDEFIACAEAVRQMPEPEEVDEYTYDLLFELPTYLTMYADLLDKSGELTLIPHAPLTEASASVETLLTVMIVNPHSENVDLAAKYLEFRASNESVRVKYLMSPLLNEPIENDEYVYAQMKYQEQMDELVRRREAAEPEQAAQLESEIISLRNEMAREDSRWLISPDSLQSYLDIAPMMLITGDSATLEYESDRNFQQLMGVAEVFLESDMSGERFAAELNNKVKIMDAER